MSCYCYRLNSTIPSPGQSTTLIEFSPSGRFLAIGDQSFSSLFILDKFAGYHPTISAAMLAEPTALVWETSKTFYVGLSDGCFVHYRLDLGNRKLVKGPVNRFFHGVFPVTAIALDSECRTLVLSVGPEVFAFRRTHATGGFCLSMKLDGELTSLKANFTSPPIFRADSTSNVTPGSQVPHSRGPFVSPPIIHLSSHFLGRT